MKKIDILGIVGILVAVAAGWAFREGKPIPGKLDYYLIAGATLVLANLLLRWEDVAGAIGARQLRHGGNMAVLILVVLAILGAVNYLVNRHTKRWDLTKNQRFSLSDQTRKILANLKEDIRITYFQRTIDLAAGQDRMKQFSAASPRVKIDYIDPIKDPAKARSYGITVVPTLVLERGGRQEKVQSDSEQDVTNGLIKVTREGKKTVCLAEGEGEKDVDDSSDRGFSAAKSALGKSQYETKKVVLLREKTVPEDCSVLVVAGPQKDLLELAVDAIRDYVKKGGKLFVMVDPEFKESYPNLTGLLKEWNIETAKDVIVDVSGIGQLFGTGPLTPIAGPQYPYHEITRDFRVMTAFHEARSVKAGKDSKDGVFVQNLVETSPASWAETDLTLKEPVQMDEGKDTKGPVPLGAVATLRVAEPKPAPSPSPSPAASPSASPEEEAKKPEGRVVAIGDSDWASNSMLGFQGNNDFFLNIVAWLAQDTDLISIRPKEPDDQKMFLTANQQANVRWLAIGLIPGLFVVLGISTWFRRR